MFHKLFIALLFSLTTLVHAITLKVNGSSTVGPVATEVGQVFQNKGWKLTVDTQGGSSGGIVSLAEGLSHVGMISRELTETDRKKFPKTNFQRHLLGYDGVALAVSKKLYDEGIQQLTKSQLKEIYEGKIKNWKKVGGPDRKIVFFNKEPGRGTWEVFAKYLYKNPSLAPKVFHPEVGSNQEARTKVSQHPSAITQLSYAWVKPEFGLMPIKIISEGKAIIPTKESIMSRQYPLARPLYLLTDGNPKGQVKEYIAYFFTPEGEKLMNKFGYIPK